MRCLATSIVSALALIALAPLAHAQQSGPIRLAPDPVPAKATPEASQPEVLPTERPGGVLIRGLDAVAEDAVGTLTIADGSLGDEMWDGSSRATAIRLLEELPVAAPSGAARRLTRRLLLSIATPPSGAAKQSSLLAARVAGLVAIGAPDDAIRLANAANSRRVSDDVARPVVAAHFLRGDIAGGCAVLARYESGYTERFWQKALIVCQIAGGKGAEASFSLDLLREEHVDADRAFESIAYTLAEGSPVTESELAIPGAADILNFALLTAAEVELPDWILDSEDAAILRAALASSRVAPERKLARAHAALRAGRIDPAEMVAIYETLEADDVALAAALLAPDSVERDTWLAYLYLAARNQKVAIARSEALWEAWTLSAAAEAEDIVMAATARLLGDIPATADFDWFAAAATRASLLAGEDALALDWYQLVVRQAGAVTDMDRATTEMWPEMRIIGRNLAATPIADRDLVGEVTAEAKPAPAPATSIAPTPMVTVMPLPAQAAVPWSPTRLSRWIDLTESNPGMADVGTALYLLQVLGDQVNERQWARAAITNPTPAPQADTGRLHSVAALAGLERASAAGRLAETALYAVIVLGQAGDNPHPGVIGSVVRGLQRVGLDADAQAVARAALVARER